MQKYNFFRVFSKVFIFAVDILDKNYTFFKVFRSQVMDGIANVARQQQSQVSPQETQGKVEQTQLQVQQSNQSNNENLLKQTEDIKSDTEKQSFSQKDVDELIQKLNEAMAPLNTEIKFGVDQNDIFYVAAIDSKTNKIIRRFPAEQAQDFLPKMQEVTGILFDSKG